MEVSVYGKKVIKRDIYQIIIPMILENILQISANLVITAMVGRLLARHFRTGDLYPDYGYIMVLL